MLENIGAGEGIRTLDPNLGKVVLYTRGCVAARDRSGRKAEWTESLADHPIARPIERTGHVHRATFKPLTKG